MEKAKTAEYPVIWIQCATCTGCSVSVLNSVSPTIKNVLIDEVIPGKHVNLRFHATVMAGSGDLVINEMEETAVKSMLLVSLVAGSGFEGENNEKQVISFWRLPPLLCPIQHWLFPKQRWLPLTS